MIKLHTKRPSFRNIIIIVVAIPGLGDGEKLHGERSVPILWFQGPRRFGVSAPSGLHERWTKGKGRERDGRYTRQGVPCVLIAFGLVCNFRRHFTQSTRKFFVLFRSRIRVGDVLPVGLYCWLRSNGIVGVFNGRWSFSILSWVCSSVHSTHKKEQLISLFKATARSESKTFELFRWLMIAGIPTAEFFSFV